MVTRWISIVVVLAMGIGCGSPDETAAPASPDPSDPLTYMGYSCDGAGPPAYRLSDPYDPDDVPEEAWEAFERFREGKVDPIIKFPNEQDWDVVVLTSERVTWLTKSSPYQNTSAAKENGVWEWAGFGDCHLGAIGEGELENAEWWIAEEPRPDSEVLEVEAMQIACASATKRTRDEFVPEVHTGEDQVAIAMFVEPLDRGAYDCPGNPSTRVDVRLDEPLGDRKIVDVSIYPTRSARTKGPFE